MTRKPTEYAVFVITGNGCAPTDPRHAGKFPIAIWVERKPEFRWAYRPGRCDSKLVYRVLPRSARRVVKTMGLPVPDDLRRVFVCKHMGHLIK